MWAFQEHMVWARLKSKKTRYIQEKTSCRNVPLTDLVAPKFISSVKELCGSDACVPKGFPSTALRKCEVDEKDCSYSVLRNSFVSLQKDVNVNTVPCDDLGYTGTYFTDVIEVTTFSEEFLCEDNWDRDKSQSLVYYTFDLPEIMTVYDEYYIVPILDLIGLVGGTLGMFIGFSFYGTISDIFSLTVSLITKTGRLSFAEYFTIYLVHKLIFLS